MKKDYLKEQIEAKRMFPLLLKFIIPCIFAQVLNTMYNIVDRMFIGHIEGDGALALSGLGICFPIISLVTAFAWLIGMGGAPLLSILIGEEKDEEAAKIQTTSFIMLLCVGIILTVVCYIFAEPLLVIFGASETLLPYALIYLRTYVLGTTAVMIATGMNSFINAQGRTVIGTMTIAIGAILNIILDYIFVLVMHMNIFGAAMATVISQMVSAIWILLVLTLSKKLDIKLEFEKLKIERKYVKSILSLGFSSFIFMANESLIEIILNRILRNYTGYDIEGDLYIGTMTIVITMSQMMLMPLQGVTQGMQPIVGYCKGAGEFKKMKQIIMDAKILGVTFACICWFIFMFAPGWAVSLLSNDMNLIDLSKSIIRLSFWECFLFGIQMVNQHMFVAVGNAKYSFFFAILRKIILLIPLAFILPVFVGVKGVFLAEPIATVITVIVTQIAFSKYLIKISYGKKTSIVY